MGAITPSRRGLKYIRCGCNDLICECNCILAGTVEKKNDQAVLGTITLRIQINFHSRYCQYKCIVNSKFTM